MKTLSLDKILPININDGWKSFSDPGNMKGITPLYMGFKIPDKLAEKLYQRMINKYEAKPIFNFPITWDSKIARLEETLNDRREKKITYFNNKIST